MPDAEKVLPTGLDLIHAERRRQIDSEGWTPEHDAKHGMSTLLRAAECYEHDNLTYGWPWGPEWWKPKDALSNLIRAGALFLAAQEVVPDAPPAGTQGAKRCAEKIDAILAKASSVLSPEVSRS